MEENKNLPKKPQDWAPPEILERRELNIELFSDEPPVEPPWPGP